MNSYSITPSLTIFCLFGNYLGMLVLEIWILIKTVMENKIKFEVGETVRLNSGGPLLTVSKLLENEQVECVWFNDLDDVCTHIFDAALLFPDDDEEWFEVEDYEEGDDDEEFEDEDLEEEDDEKG